MDKRFFVFFRYIFAPLSVIFAFFNLGYITVISQLIVVLTCIFNIYKYKKDKTSNSKHFSVATLDFILILGVMFIEDYRIYTPMIAISMFLTLLVTEEVRKNKGWNTPFK